MTYLRAPAAKICGRDEESLRRGRTKKGEERLAECAAGKSRANFFVSTDREGELIPALTIRARHFRDPASECVLMLITLGSVRQNPGKGEEM